MDKAEQKSIEWQKANHPMAIGGDAFADIVDSFNVNPAFVAGYKEAEKDLALTWEDVKKIVTIADSMLTHTAWDAVDWPDEQVYYQEVLKRFLEQRKK